VLLLKINVKIIFETILNFFFEIELFLYEILAWFQ